MRNKLNSQKSSRELGSLGFGLGPLGLGLVVRSKNKTKVQSPKTKAQSSKILLICPAFIN